MAGLLHSAFSKGFDRVLITRTSSISTAEHSKINTNNNNLASASAGYAMKIEGLTCSHHGVSLLGACVYLVRIIRNYRFHFCVRFFSHKQYNVDKFNTTL